MNAKNYHKHRQKELFPAINKIFSQKDWIFIEDGATYHTSNLVQDFLKETMPRRYIKKISGFQNHQTASHWFISSGIRLT